MGGGHFQNVGLNLATIVVFGPYFGNATTLGLILHIWNSLYMAIFVKTRKKLMMEIFFSKKNFQS